MRWFTKRSFVSPKPQFPQLKMEYSAGENSRVSSRVTSPFPNLPALANSDRV